MIELISNLRLRMLIGIFLVVAGVYSYYSQISLERIAIRTQGEVIGLDAEYWRSGRGSSYAPIVAFKIQDGRKIIYKSSHYSCPAGYEVGDEVKVLYEPGNPERASIDDFRSSRLPIILLLVVGLIIIIPEWFQLRKENDEI